MVTTARMVAFGEYSVDGTASAMKAGDYKDATDLVAQPIALAENTIGRKPENGGNGDGFTDGGPMYTLNATGVHGVAQPIAYAFDSLSSNSMKSSNPNSGVNQVNVSKTLDTSRGLDPSCNQGGIGVAQPIPLNTMNCFRSPDADASTGCGIGDEGEAMFTITKTNSHAVAQPIGLDEEQNAMIDAFGTLKARTQGGGFQGSVMQANMDVRRLTPVECERLQGFPDNYTNIKDKCPDGPRYKALGNSWAVPVVRWIGERIANEVA